MKHDFCWVFIAALTIASACSSKDGDSTAIREKELEVQLAQAKAAQAQAEAERAKATAGAGGTTVRAPEAQARVMTADETAHALANNDAPSLAAVAKSHPLVNPPACDAAIAWLNAYLQCDQVPQDAGFGHRDHRNRCMTITWFGHGDRSEATLVGPT